MTQTEMIAAINYLVAQGKSFEDLVSLAEDYRDRFGSWVAVSTLLSESDAPQFYCAVVDAEPSHRSHRFISSELGGKSWRECFDWIIHNSPTPADRLLWTMQYREEIEEEPEEIDPEDTSFITSDMFSAKLEEICFDQNLLAIAGVYEIVSEHFNNEVIEALQDERARA